MAWFASNCDRALGFCFFWMRRERLECDFSGNAIYLGLAPFCLRPFYFVYRVANATARHRRAGQVPRKLLLNATDTRVHKELLQLPEGSFQGKPPQARVASVYGWFTEGFHTLDRKEAKALLEQLGS